MSAVQALLRVRQKLVESRRTAGDGSGQWFGLQAAIDVVDAEILSLQATPIDPQHED